MKKAVVLLSGGLDSATVAALVKSQGYEVYALTFQYGQRHSVEVAAAHRVASAVGVEVHNVISIDPTVFGRSALTDHTGSVPAAGATTGVPSTYVPARNTIFLSYALAWAEVLDAQAICIGVNALDYSGYPDCRPEFIAAYQAVASLGIKDVGVLIKAPLMHMTKAEIIRLGATLGVDYAATHSCYSPSADGAACGACDACDIRARGFRSAGVPDPTVYGGAGAAMISTQPTPLPGGAP